MKQKQRRHREKTFEFKEWSIPDHKREEFWREIQRTATLSIDRFSTEIQTLQSHFRRYNPLIVLSSYAFHGIYTTNRKHQGAIRDASQFHYEFLQAIALSIPACEWGTADMTPTTAQEVFECVSRLADSRLHEDILEMENPGSLEGSAVQSMQHKARMITKIVRHGNLSHFGNQLIGELYGGMDDIFVDECGFTISELIGVIDVVMSETKSRAEEHLQTLRFLRSGHTTRQLYEHYETISPGITRQADLPTDNLDAPHVRNDAVLKIKTALDSQLPSRFSFAVDEIAQLAGYSTKVVTAIIHQISMPTSTPVEQDFRHLFLGNPIWLRPFVRYGDRFFMPLPQMALSHVHAIVYEIAKSKNLDEKVYDRRSSFLQSKVCTVLERVFDKACIRPNLHWQLGDQQFETDCFVQVDRVALIVEAKSHHLNPSAMRGSPDRLKRQTHDLILEPSEQSSRLAETIREGKLGNESAAICLKEAGIDCLTIDKVVRLSVTLDDLSVFCTSERELKKAGWIPDDHSLALTISIIDLMTIVDLLPQPLLFLHYLVKRFELQKSLDVVCDEVELVGEYIERGLDFPVGSKEYDMLIPTSQVSQRVQNYVSNLQRGIKPRRPSVNLSPYFNDVMRKLDRERPDGWMSIGLSLLNSVFFDQQREIDRRMKIEMANVRKSNYGDSRYFFIYSDDTEIPLIVFYLHPSKLCGFPEFRLKRAAKYALEEIQCNDCYLIGRNVENTDEPSDGFVYFTKNRHAVEVT